MYMLRPSVTCLLGGLIGFKRTNYWEWQLPFKTDRSVNCGRYHITSARADPTVCVQSSSIGSSYQRYMVTHETDHKAMRRLSAVYVHTI